jgi:hypothetical protein
VLFAAHFLAYVPRVVRLLRADWSAARLRAVPGAGARAMLPAAAVGGGAALARLCYRPSSPTAAWFTVGARQLLTLVAPGQ